MREVLVYAVEDLGTRLELGSVSKKECEKLDYFFLLGRVMFRV